MSWGPKSPVHCFAWLKPIRLRSLTTQQLQNTQQHRNSKSYGFKKLYRIVFFQKHDASRCKQMQIFAAVFFVCYTYPDSLWICVMGWGWLGGTFGHYPLRPLDKNDLQPQTHTSTLGVEDSRFDEHIFQMGGSTTNQNCFHFISVFWDFLPNLAGYSRCGMPWGVPWADIACSTCFASTGDVYGCCILLLWNQCTKWDCWKCCQCFENENQSGADNHWLPTDCAGRPRLGRHIIWRQTVRGQGKAPTWGGSQYNLGWWDQNPTHLPSKWHKVTLLISFVLRHQRHRTMLHRKNLLMNVMSGLEILFMQCPSSLCITLREATREPTNRRHSWPTGCRHGGLMIFKA